MYYFALGEGLFLDTARITQLLLGWYATHYRSLPWRQNPTPYHVWISEIMLQQTRIEAVLPYYERFIAALPDVVALSSVSTETLLKLWEGLGYYSRARNLQKAAQVVVSEYGGELPADYDRLLSLPGIGPYTAGAIASIAFSIPVPAVDGNVMRVLSRLTADDTDVLSTAGKKRFSELAWQLVPEEAPGRFNQALMELGETVCLPNGTPRCELCPLNAVCAAHRGGCAEWLPVRIKKQSRRIEKRAVAVVRLEDKPPSVLLHHRPERGLLAGLWELPNTTESDPLESLPSALRPFCREVDSLTDCKHIFSHVEWHMSGRLYTMPADVPLPEGFRAATLDELQHTYPLPSAFRQYALLFPRLLNDEEY